MASEQNLNGTQGKIEEPERCIQYKYDLQNKEKLDLKKKRPTDIQIQGETTHTALVDETTLNHKGLGAEKYIHGSDPTEELDRLERQYSTFLNRPLWQNTNLSTLVPLQNQNEFLEIGCGVAAQTPTLLSMLPKEMKVVGIDLDPLKIARATEKMKKYSDRCSFRAMDASNLSIFADDQFNGAYICWVLEHLTPGKALSLLKEVRRVVAPGGFIVINEAIMDPDTSLTVQSLNGCPPFTKSFALSLEKMQSELGGNANFGTESNMITFLNEAGYTNFSYNKNPFHILQDLEWQKDFQEWLIDCLGSVVAVLDTSGEFSKEKFENVKEEIRANNDVMLSYGTSTIVNSKD